MPVLQTFRKEEGKRPVRKGLRLMARLWSFVSFIIEMENDEDEEELGNGSRQKPPKTHELLYSRDCLPANSPGIVGNVISYRIEANPKLESVLEALREHQEGLREPEKTAVDQADYPDANEDVPGGEAAPSEP